MSERERFYRWWAKLTNDERRDCWYDLDAMAHPEVVSSLRQKLAASEAKLVEAERKLKALDLLCAFASETEAHVALYVLDGGLRRVEVGSIWTNGDSAGAAALILAAGHGLLGS